jgi:hypothetical protein
MGTGSAGELLEAAGRSVALQMLLEGDLAALNLYHAGNHRHPRVIAYLERLSRGEEDVPLFVEHCEAAVAEVNVTRR